NKNWVPENSNRLYGTDITVTGFNTSLNGNSNNIIKVRKVGRSTYFTEGKMEDKWDEIITSAFDPPRKMVALPVYGINKGQPFDSGSPVVDEDNQVVGILHGGVKGKADAYVIPIHVIKEHVKES
ncbi:16114_t:CDS:2, partial [Racocetra persica]